MDLRTILEQLLSPDQTTQKAAENGLVNFLGEDYERGIARLSDVVRSSEVPDTLRQSAALAFKNALSSKDTGERAKRRNAWMGVTVAAKSHVKDNLLEALKTDKAGLGRSVAQCVACVAVCELESDGWHELIPFLADTVTNPESVCKQSSLEAIGYICEEATAAAIDPYTTTIVASIICAMKVDQLSPEVRLAAATALQSSLTFFGKHFENKDERDHIMQTVCEATLAEDVRLKTAALQCIITITQLYYQQIEPYVETGLMPITCRAMSFDGSDEVVLQGIEFWSALSEEEIALKYEKDQASKSGAQFDRESFNLVSKHLHVVVPCLLQWLTRQPDLDEDEWIPAKAAAGALMLIAQCVEDQIVPPVISFVESGMQSPDWHARDAACIAFGAILDGPNSLQLKPMVDVAYNFILRLMHDDSVTVRDSAAWVIQRMCEFLGPSGISPKRLLETLLVLQENLNCVPRAAANVCWAITALARISYGLIGSDKVRPESTAMSPVFTSLIADLLKTGFRGDSMQNNLRTAAFEALNQLIAWSPHDCYPEVRKTAITLYKYISGALEKDEAMNSAERARYGDYCQHWFSVLESILRRLDPDDVKGVRDNVFTVCLRTLDLHRAGRSFQAEPEALSLLLTLLELEPLEFSSRLDVLHPYVIAALCSFSEHTIVNGGLALVSEICRQYETAVLRFVSSYVDHITALISQLNDPSGLVKPRAICTLGDVALSMGSGFFPFAVRSFECLSAVTAPQDDQVWISLLDGILEACVGLFQCLQTERHDDGHTVMRAYAKFIVPLIQSAAGQLAAINDQCVGNCAVLMIFLCDTFGREMLPIVDCVEFYALLNRGKLMTGTKTKKMCSVTLKELNRLKDDIAVYEGVAR